MTLALGDFIQIIDTQLYLDQIMVNVYHYEVTKADALVGEQAVLDAWAADRLPGIALVQDSNLMHTELRIDNLTDGIHFAVINPNLPGDVAAPGMPSATSMGWRFNVTTKTTRPGGKRIGGLTDVSVLGNDLVLDAPQRAFFETAFFATLSVSAIPGETEIDPVIIGRDILGALDLNRTQRTFSGSVASEVTTQASRRANKAP